MIRRTAATMTLCTAVTVAMALSSIFAISYIVCPSDAFSLLTRSHYHRNNDGLLLHHHFAHHQLQNTATRSTAKVGMFGDLKKAFENDSSLGKAKDAGLSRGPTRNENVSINGNNVNAIVGQKVSVVAASARVKINYDCRNGDCGTCMIKINGRKVKACQQIIPSGRCSIETL